MPAGRPVAPRSAAPQPAIPATRPRTPTPAVGTSSGARGWHQHAPRRIAAIDIGSNSIRAIVADVSSTGQIRTVDEMKAAPRLSTGVDETGHLQWRVRWPRSRRCSAW